MSRIASQTLQAAVLVTLLWSTAVATTAADDTISLNEIKKTTAVPPGFEALPIGKKVNKALGWNLEKDNGTFPSYLAYTGHSDKYMSKQYFSKIDYNLNPFAGQKDVMNVDFEDSITTEDGTWLLTSANSDGRFGSGVKKYTVQYFAFALYVSEEQNIMYKYKCTDECLVFVGGSAIDSSTLYTVTEGYKQVIVKTFTKGTEGPMTGFTFEISQGYGIAVGTEVPYLAPPGTNVLIPGAFVTEFLTVKTPFEGTFETDYLGKNNSDGTVRPEKSDPLFMRVADSGKGFSVRGKGASGKNTVNYFSTGLLASNGGMVTISLPTIGGSMIIWLDGKAVYHARGTIQGGDVFGFKVTEGWHQMLIKVYVDEGADDWFFRMEMLESENTVLYTGLQVPNNLPSGASNILDKQISGMIVLKPDYINNDGIPFNFKDATDHAFSDPTFSLVDVNKKPKGADKVSVNGKNWVWAFSYAEDKHGVFSVPTDSGAVNRYYAFALYFTESVAQLNLSVMHYSGMGMWMDGKQVLAKKDKSDG
eukprot:Tbor_TRINITY_DN6234_c5_g1::TRINITY_DN6234_c5_g1_i6::g.1971::m.1971